MIRTKRFLSLFLAVTISLTSMVPSYAEGTFISDVSGQYEETGFEDVSENLTAEKEKDSEQDISSQSEEKDETVHTMTIDTSLFFVQQGGLKQAETEEYSENLYGATERECDVKGAVNAVFKAVGEHKEVVDLRDYNLYCDKTTASEEYLTGIVAQAVNYEPSYFYFSDIDSYGVDDEGYFTFAKLTFDYNNNEAEYISALKKAYKEAVTDDSAPAYVKAMQLHDWLVQHVDYDINASNANRHSAYGAIVDRKAVCMGYSLAYGDLLSMAGISCGYVTSEALNHMWNVVKIDDEWYHVDTTWDDPLGRYLGTTTYSFFLKSESVFRKYPTSSKNHQAGDWVYRASNTYSYWDISSVNASSKKYDKYWWNDASSSVIYAGKSFYYVKSDTNDASISGGYRNDSLVRRNTDGSVETILDMRDFLWDESQFSSGPIRTIDIYGTNQSNKWTCLSYVDGYIFFNGPKQLYRLKVGESTPRSIYTVTEKGFFIWTCIPSGNRMLMGIGKFYPSSSGGTKSTFLFAVENFVLNASTKTLTHGSKTKAELSASYKKNSSSTVNIKWYVLRPNTTEYEEIEGENSTKYTVDPTVYDAGTYKFKIVLEIDDVSVNKVVTIIINKETLSVKNKDYHVSKTYDAKPLPVPAYENFTTNAPKTAVSFAWYKTEETVAKDKLESEPVSAGTYYLKITAAATTNVKGGSKVIKVVIAKKDLSVTIMNQTLFYGTPVSSLLSDIEFDSSQLIDGESVYSVKLAQDTTEPTEKGKITCSNIKIVRGSVNVTSNYKITYTNGKLVINRLPIKVIAKDQTITYGDLVSSDRNMVDVSANNFYESFAVGSVKIEGTIQNAGEGQVIPRNIVIYKRGTMTDVTKNFDLLYVPGVLTVNKADLEPSKLVAEIRIPSEDYSSGELKYEDYYDIPDLEGKTVETQNYEGGDNSKIFFSDDSFSFSVSGGSGNEYIAWWAGTEVTFDNYNPIKLKLCIKMGKEIPLVFHGNGGTFPEGEERKENIFAPSDAPVYSDLKKIWYEFDGWYTEPIGGEEIYAIGTDSVPGDLYAHWKIKNKVSTIKTDADYEESVEPGTRIGLSTDTYGATIYYTTDGSKPDVSSNVYTDAIVVNETVTIKAVAVKDHFENSDLFVKEITVNEDPWGDIEDSDRAFYAGNEGKTWVAGLENKIYNGKSQTQSDIRVYFDKKLLTLNKDYTITYKKNKNAGAAEVTVKGKGNYKDTVTFSFDILPADISTATASDMVVSFTGKNQTPKPKLNMSPLSPKEKSDYIIKYLKDGESEPTDKVKSAGKYEIIILAKDGGNYTGELTVGLTVTEYILMSKVTVTGVADSYKYTGEAVEPKFKVKYKTEELNDESKAEYVDYTYEFVNNKDTGTAKLILKGKENTQRDKIFIGTKTITFKIKSYISISDAKIVYNDGPYYCDGNPVIPDFTLLKGKTELVRDKDYTVKISNNLKPGKIKIVCKGIGKYKASRTFKVDLKAVSISKATVTGYRKSFVYTAEPIEQEEVELYLGDTALVKDKDYKVTYKANKNVGTATVTFTGINEYKGSIKKTFKITKYNLLTGGRTELTFNYDKKVKYQKNGAKPYHELIFNGYTLKENVDYTVSYKNNDQIGNKNKLPKIIIKGKKNFTGTIEGVFAVEKADIGDCKLVFKEKTYSGRKGAFKQSPTVKDTNGVTLKAGKDYVSDMNYTYGEDVVVSNNGTDVDRVTGESIDASDIIPAGTRICVIVTGKGNYKGTVTGYYRLYKASINKAKATVKAQTYTGKAVTPGKSDITITLGKNKEVLSSSDYEIIGYSKNIKKGTGYVLIRGTGDYCGSIKVKFTIKSGSLSGQ